MTQQPVDELLKRLQLLLIRYEVEFINKVHVVLEASIEMGFSTQGRHPLKVAVVNVGIDAEQALEDVLDPLDKVRRERDPCVHGRGH